MYSYDTLWFISSSRFDLLGMFGSGLVPVLRQNIPNGHIAMQTHRIQYVCGSRVLISIRNYIDMLRGKHLYRLQMH